MLITDSHAHLTNPQLVSKTDELVERAKAASVQRIVNICTDEQSLIDGLALAKRSPLVYNAAATTPHDVETEGASFFPQVERCAKEGLLIAIGETGLDYFYEHSPKDLQQEFLIRYFALARECRLPVIIHCRDAFADLFRLADTHYRDGPLLLHCFTGTQEEAEEGVRRGWKISMSGIITFKKSEALRDVVRHLPLENLLVETDAPYLAPQTKRGQENEPAFVVETLGVMAALKDVSLEKMAAITTQNADELFSFSKS